MEGITGMTWKVLLGGGGRWKEGAGHVSLASWPGVGRSWASSLTTLILL